MSSQPSSSSSATITPSSQSQTTDTDDEILPVQENVRHSRLSSKDISDMRKNFFKKDTSGTTKCTLVGCNNQSFKKAKCSNLRRHLIRRHKTVWDAFEKAAQINSRKRKLSSLEDKDPFIKVRMSEKTLRTLCVERCTKDGRPLRSINDGTWQKVVRRFQEGLPPMNRITPDTVKQDIIDKAEELRANLKEEMKDKFVSLKIDCASRCLQSYVGINCQFLEGSKLQVRTIGVVPINVAHTGENLRDIVLENLAKYSVPLRKVLSCTTDNANNMLKTIRLLNEESLSGRRQEPDNEGENDEGEYDDFEEELSPSLRALWEEAVVAIEDAMGAEGVSIVRCAAHTLQLAIMDAIGTDAFEPLITKIRALMRKLRTETIMRIINEMGAKRPILDNDTRWNSVFAMLERFLELREFCSIYAPEVKLDDDEWETLSELVMLLGRCKKASVQLQKEALPFSEVLKIFTTLCGKLDRSESHMADLLVTKIRSRMEKIYTKDLFAAVILDPRYKNLLNPEQVLLGKLRLASVWRDIVQKTRDENQALDEEVNEETDDQQSDDTDSDEEFLKSVMKENEEKFSCFKKFPDPTRREREIEYRIEALLRSDTLPADTNIFEYWESVKFEKPELYLLSSIFLCIPATQCSVERLFSHLAYIRSKYRINLSNQLLECILLLRMNDVFSQLE